MNHSACKSTLLPLSETTASSRDETGAHPAETSIPPVTPSVAFCRRNNAKPSLSPDKLLVLGGLGVGGFGVVVEVAGAGVETRLAMKCMSKNKFSHPKRRKQLATEIRVLTDVKPSPFLLQCHLAFETDSTIFLVTDLLSGGDLFFRLDEMADQGQSGFPEEKARTVLAEVALGLCHLHSRGFVHRDIKVENIMVSADGHIKLVDFGLAVDLPAETNGNVAEIPISVKGSLIYMAPEIFQQKIGGRFTDWWALGILCYELLTGRSPWSTLSDQRRIIAEIASLSVNPPTGISDAGRYFISSLLRKDHLLRLGTYNDADVLASPFFACVNWYALESGKAPPAFYPVVGGEPFAEEVATSAAIEAFDTETSQHGSSPGFDLKLVRASQAPPRWNEEREAGTENR